MRPSADTPTCAMEFLDGCKVTASITLKSNRGVFAIDTHVQSVVDDADDDADAEASRAPDPAVAKTNCLFSKGFADGLVEASISSNSH